MSPKRKTACATHVYQHQHHHLPTWEHRGGGGVGGACLGWVAVVRKTPKQMSDDCYCQTPDERVQRVKRENAMLRDRGGVKTQAKRTFWKKTSQFGPHFLNHQRPLFHWQAQWIMTFHVEHLVRRAPRTDVSGSTRSLGAAWEAESVQDTS